ncbi:CAF17-like 4Fe-4S cluster assembly/insertion protein YgfZ [Stagnihabitans tardus]|uniref:Folate-binding protein n=1 Tax=Stagnihabitans tardus TaxID=2699202 RepID=A0AAE4Y9X2_9RHOB|nr:folate-binding protein YgfZ [Stagnihabitans tardus]NBZ88738.1 folate-binding protein [Stagnihabitans tardus]
MERRIVGLEGADVLPFLQGLVTNDVLPLAKGKGLVWAGLLTPQGKYLADFFVGNDGGGLFLDLPEPMADGVLRRLTMYRLRADVRFVARETGVVRGLGAAPEGALADPRHEALGWRLYGAGAEAQVDWDAIRVEAMVPESGIELVPEESYPLELGFERLRGVDFRKGCYVGQEVTARMKHKTELRKGLVRVALEAPVPVGTPVTAAGKEAGAVYTQSGGRGLAWLRFDRTEGAMEAAGGAVRLAP